MDGGFVEHIFRGHTGRCEEEIVVSTTIVNLHQQLCGGIFQQGALHLKVEGQNDALIFGQREGAALGDA